VPAVVVDERSAPALAPSRIETVKPNGYRVLVDGGVDEAALVRVLQGRSPAATDHGGAVLGPWPAQVLRARRHRCKRKAR
jgi:hypothetical protein